jgi:hypothetical protein
MRHSFIQLMCICVVGFLAGQAEAARDYYVSENGVDPPLGTSPISSQGTLTNPLKTINCAATWATAGSNVYVRGGSYRETVTVQHSGTSSSAAITFQPYNNE